MNDNRTTSILQRVPVILAVTAASYGLQPDRHAARAATGAGKNALPRSPQGEPRAPDPVAADH